MEECAADPRVCIEEDGSAPTGRYGVAVNVSMIALILRNFFRLKEL